MSESREFRVERDDEDFTAELAAFEKEYYRRKKEPLENFRALLEDIFDSLEANPRNKNPPLRRVRAHFEPWPKGLQQEHLEFWKLTFPMPGHAGDSGQGRLMYLVNLRSNLVLPVWIYTHKNYTKRPPEDEIRGRLDRSLAEYKEKG